MSYKDFLSNFQTLDICFLGPDSMAMVEEGDNIPGKWESNFDDGSWQAGVNAGGCRNFPGKSQYLNI